MPAKRLKKKELVRRGNRGRLGLGRRLDRLGRYQRVAHVERSRIKDRFLRRTSVQRHDRERQTESEKGDGQNRRGACQGIAGPARAHKSAQPAATAAHAQRTALGLLEQDNDHKTDRNKK